MIQYTQKMMSTQGGEGYPSYKTLAYSVLFNGICIGFIKRKGANFINILDRNVNDVDKILDFNKLNPVNQLFTGKRRVDVVIKLAIARGLEVS